MHLKTIWYREHEGLDAEWTLEEVTFGKVNLITGKNASGKSRILNVLNATAQVLAGSRELADGHFRLGLVHEGVDWTYEYKVTRKSVEFEKLTRGDKVLILRPHGGEGKIWAERSKRMMAFQPPSTSLAAINRQDAIQHSYLEPLIKWAGDTYHYPFASSLGQNMFAMVRKDSDSTPDLHDPQQTIGVYLTGKKVFGDRFTDRVREGMNLIGYSISEIGVMAPQVIKVEGPAGDLTAIYVQESDLPGPTEQISMSTGMFRAFSLIIHLVYGELSGARQCVLIDDIGEGLDFDRSKALIEFVVDLVADSSIQLILTSNDRFIMNAVPLEYWTVLSRSGNVVRPYSQANSPKIFADFRYTGLSNFDFLARNFVGGAKVH